MRIPGFALRSTVEILPAGEDYGDGPIDQAPVTVKAQLAAKQAVVIDQNGRTLTRWTVARIRPTVLVGSPGRRPAPGDRIRIDGLVREITAVEPVLGPGAAVAYLEITTANGSAGQGIAGDG